MSPLTSFLTTAVLIGGIPAVGMPVALGGQAHTFPAVTGELIMGTFQGCQGCCGVQGGEKGH